MLKHVLAVALAGSVATPLAAQESPAKAEKPKMVCRTEGETGSRLARRVCKTSEEWAAIDAGRAQSVRDAQQSSAISAPR